MRVDGGAGAVVVGGDVAGGIVVGGVVVVGVVVVGVVVVGVVVGVVRGSVVVDEVFGAADIGVVGVLPVPEAVRRMTTMAATTAAPMAPTMTRFLFMAHSSWTLYWGRHIGENLFYEWLTGRDCRTQEILKEATDFLSKGRKWVQSAFAPATTTTLLACWPTTKHAISL